uniref:TMV resistance protein N n=1 Tax=Populus trichocarpa TaxID=3694 RepID=A0A2K1R7W1_POPTR
MEMVSFQMQTWRFQIELQGNRFNVGLEYDENEMLAFYEEEGLIQKEFEEHLSFKISSPATHRICGFNLFTWFSATPVSNPYLHVYLEIGNNTKCRFCVFYPSIFPIEFSAERSELLWLSYWKFGSNDPVFDTGDEFSVSVFTDDPVVQMKRVGVRMLHEEEGTDDDSSSSNTSDDKYSNTCGEASSESEFKWT